jgi:hypothetical protein
MEQTRRVAHGWYDFSHINTFKDQRVKKPLNIAKYFI